MTKECPNCGESLPDDAHFCIDCGYNFSDNSNGISDLLSNGKVFLILIVAILIIGSVWILTSSGNDGSADVSEDKVYVDMAISEVNGYDGYSDGKTYYSLWTSALFNKVPSDKNGYLIKTTYYDRNNSEVGHETEKLSNVYYDTDYGITFGYYTTYVKPDLDHVDVDIIKDGNVVDNYTYKVNRNEIDFLN